jgi:four helix bundle protein
MGVVSRFEDLKIWQVSREQALQIYRLSLEASFAADYSFRHQINRSALSVMDNIAEGFERSGNNELINFLFIAKGSNGEVRSQLYAALDRGHLTSEIANELLINNETLSKMISSMIGHLKTSGRRGYRYS